MNWTADKIAHYKKSFNWARTGLILGVWPIIIFFIAGRTDWWIVSFPFVGAFLILCLGAAKEIIYDKWMHKGCAEWLDYRANLIGVMDGLNPFKKKRFTNN